MSFEEWFPGGQHLPALAVKTVKVPFRDAVELVHSIDAFAAEPNGGLLVLPPPTVPDRDTMPIGPWR